MVLAQVRADAAAGRFDDWASSTVVDENTAEPVIDPELFDALHAAAGISASYPVGNAGVLHVYGYWFSTAPTPYGYKYQRWTDGELARAFGLSPTAFWLTEEPPAPTTLLQRVTAVALPALVNPAVGRPAREARVAGVNTRATLVRAATAFASALVYGVDTGAGWQVVTTFPVTGDPQVLLDDFEQHPRLRWNAALPSA